MQIGDWVLARKYINEGFIVYAGPGNLGHIIDLRPGHLPTILWERSGMVTDCLLSEFEILCGPDFAKYPHTTPGYQK